MKWKHKKQTKSILLTTIENIKIEKKTALIYIYNNPKLYRSKTHKIKTPKLHIRDFSRYQNCITWAQADGLVAPESLDLLFAKLSLRRSRCSFNRSARSFWYSTASALAFATLFFFSAILARFLCKVNGVTSLWILGALLHFFPGKRNRYKYYPLIRNKLKLRNYLVDLNKKV